MVTRFELEQDIMNCWQVTDDLDVLYNRLMEDPTIDRVLEDPSMNRDKLANILLGMKELYHIKFEKCFNTFERLISEKKI
jgi:hypothetical protein